MSDNPFLPDGTKIPDAPSHYLKFKSGDNKIRVIGSAITGNELWVEGKPVRKRANELFTKEELANADVNKFTGKKRAPVYFWAFPVYDYASEDVKILEITQRSVLEGIQGYLDDEDYGSDPKKYDLVIKKDDETDPVSYTVRAKPPKALDKGVSEYCKDIVANINMDALYEGDDPFSTDFTAKEKAEIDEALS